jgi:hypothetical protein
MVKVLAVIPTLKDDPVNSIQSLINQTIFIRRILVVVGSKNLYNALVSSSSERFPSQVQFMYVKPSSDRCVGKRVARALNAGLDLINLEEFDYLLRIDADIVLPSRFVEENLKLRADLVGTAGFALLIRVRPFVSLLHERFKEVCAEDSYVRYIFMQNGYSTMSWKLPPKLLRKSGKPHSWRYFYVRGLEMYKVGYEPLHVVGSLRYEVRNVFAVLGYISALFSPPLKYHACMHRKTIKICRREQH